MPGARMYEVSWQRNGESVCRLNISATNGDDVWSRRKISSPAFLHLIFAMSVLAPR
jgi:hypothetical protein